MMLDPFSTLDLERLVSWTQSISHLLLISLRLVASFSFRQTLFLNSAFSKFQCTCRFWEFLMSTSFLTCSLVCTLFWATTDQELRTILLVFRALCWVLCSTIALVWAFIFRHSNVIRRMRFFRHLSADWDCACNVFLSLNFPIHVIKHPCLSLKTCLFWSANLTWRWLLFFIAILRQG